MAAFLLTRAVQALVRLGMPWAPAVAAGGLALGLAKGALVMRPAAAKSARRIEERGDGRCLGGFLSWKSWLFVAGMAVMGKWMRGADLPPAFIGLVLGGVGAALWWGSLVFWGAWSRRAFGP